VHCRYHSTVLYVCILLCIEKRTIELCKNLHIVGRFVHPHLSIQLICVRLRRGIPLIRMKQTPWGATDTIPYQPRNATRHAWGWQLETQLIHVKQASWDATDRISWPRDATPTSLVETGSLAHGEGVLKTTWDEENGMWTFILIGYYSTKSVIGCT